MTFSSGLTDNKVVLMLAEFIAGDFCKRVPSGHDGEYLISVAISDLLLHTYDFYTVTYPPVKLSGQAGLNVAIRPYVADRKLQLVNIADQCYYKNGDEGIVRIESIYDVLRDKFQPTHQSTDEQLCLCLHLDKLTDLQLID